MKPTLLQEIRIAICGGVMKTKDYAGLRKFLLDEIAWMDANRETLEFKEGRK